jgi:hypothetical protein
LPDLWRAPLIVTRLQRREMIRSPVWRVNAIVSQLRRERKGCCGRVVGRFDFCLFTFCLIDLDWKSTGSTGILQVMRRRLVTAIAAAVVILVLTSKIQREAYLNRTHCIVDELAAAGLFDP